MTEKSEISPITINKIRIQKDFINSAETNTTFQPEHNSRTKRTKKPKCIEDLGFEERTKKPKKLLKKLKAIQTNTPKKTKKTEICKMIFNNLKQNENFEKFSHFNKLEKRVKLNTYKNHIELALDIRKTFENLFLAFAGNPLQYGEVCKLSNHFEETYKDYENKIFTKESKNILELKKKMNRLRKEIRDTGYSTNNKLKININDYNLLSEREKKISKKYKLNLVNNIKSLNSEQIKGIIHIIHDSLNFDEKSLEFDVNKLPQEKLKELDRYVKKCLKSKQNLNDIKNINIYSNINNTGNNPVHGNSNFSNNPLQPGQRDNINVSININNNFMVGNFKQNSTVNNLNLSGGKGDTRRNPILSDSDSLSSDDESDTNSLSSFEFHSRKEK